MTPALLAVDAASTTSQTLLVVIGGILVAVITSVSVYKVAQVGLDVAKVNASVAALKEHINSRMDELLKLSADVAKRVGIEEGIAKERADVAAAAKTKAELKETA